LILGFTFFDEPFKSDVERREAWEKNRDFILKRQGAPGETAHGFYQDTYDFLTRPAAWWTYEAQGRRLFISCKNEFCPYYSECQVAKSLPAEMPDCIIQRGENRTGKSSFDGLFRIECVGHKFQIFLPERETEQAFLQRNDLLNEAEKKHILETKRGDKRQ